MHMNFNPLKDRVEKKTASKHCLRKWALRTFMQSSTTLVSTKGGSQGHAGNDKDRLPPLTAW